MAKVGVKRKKTMMRGNRKNMKGGGGRRGLMEK